MPGDLVAMPSIGGLGHLGIEFAKKFGYEVATIRRVETPALTKKLGSSLHIDSEAMNAA